MSGLGRDVRRAVRGLRRSPVFLAAAVVTLAVGIGANTAIFSVVETVLLDPLPYPESDRLVTLHNAATGRDRSIHPWTPGPIHREVRESGGLEAVAGYYPQSFAVTADERPFQLEGAQATPGLFRLLGAEIALGRDFTPADARPDAPGTAIISHDVWQRRFGGSPDIVGTTVRAASAGRALPHDDAPREIIGVLEPGFRLLGPRADDPGFWLPWEVDGYAITLARLADGVSLRRAQSELDVIAARGAEDFPEARFGFAWTPLRSELVRDDRTPLLVLQFAVGAVLLIACVNMANLLLARSASRRTEVAIRAALGASGARLVRQTLTESVLVSVLGGLAALVVAALGLELLLAAAPAHLPRIDEVSIDGSVLLFTLATALLTGLLVGLAPAAATLRRAPADLLKEGGRTVARSKGRRRAGRALVVGQIALVFALLVGAGLLARSFFALTGQEPGFRTDDVLAVSLDVPRNRHRTVSELIAFHADVLEGLERVPGVESVALTRNVPLERSNSIREYFTDRSDEPRSAEYDVVSADYFRTLDIPLLAGRLFEDADRRGSLPVAIVDRAMAREAWPGRDPIGQRFRFDEGEDEDRWRTVVGVVGDIRGGGLEREPRPGFYIPHRQRPDDPVSLAIAHDFTVFLVRSATEPDRLAGPLREAIWDADPAQPVPEIASLESIIADRVGPQRFRATLLGGFAVIALILAVAGIYGVVEHLVAERRHEFGIRMAMGATRRDVLGDVLGRGVRLAALGLGAGLVIALALSRYLASLLFGVTPTDPVTVIGAAAVVVLVTLAASLLPARRATRVDPMVALRAER
ncbi:MAG: ABC transporter permease [Gemmatimonadota bacterium]